VRSGAAKNDEFKRICLGGINFVQQILGGCRLDCPRLGRREGQLAGKISDPIDTIFRHSPSIPKTIALGQA
jgi:hypothetical protein